MFETIYVYNLMDIIALSYLCKLTVTTAVFVLKKVSLKQNMSHSRSLDLHIMYVNEVLPE